jgi:RNA polymerase sigma-70 factor (ECF subfamily)
MTHARSDGLDSHRRALFGLCYRMTGSAADAEDLVQETFRRALERPPADPAAPWRPWLVKVATNLCIDALRRRRRDGYFGPWLPEPVETRELVESLEPSPEARYGALESATLAFLLALEALEPRPRAALVLRDVLGLSGPETAALLETTPGNVRVMLHRARRALEAHGPVAPTEAVRRRTSEVLGRLLAALSAGDAAAAVTLLAEDVRVVHDGGGEVIAAVRPIVGRDEVLRFYANLARQAPPPVFAEPRELNGLPAFVVRLGARPGRYADRFVLGVGLDEAGRVRTLWSVLAPAKLARLSFDD